LSALRLSTEHLIQLIEMQEQSEGDSPPLAGPIDRALAAHRHILASLETALGANRQGQPVDEPIADSPEDVSAKDANWVESPWKYLNIPSKKRGRLGPMPRFVPVPSPKKPTD
jgi:hypothetical protein